LAQGFDFEEFDKAAQPSEGMLTVTWQKRGQVGLSRAAYNALGDPEAVKLYFDREQQVMGIRAADLSAPNAIRVKHQAASGSSQFSGVAFATRYGIELKDSAQRYTAEVHDDGFLVVDLKQQPTNASKSRKR
jgi:hypothetical protein